MGRYAHPALAEREEIMLMRHEGRSPADIARATGRDRSTISREMRRNSFRVGAGPLLPGIDRAMKLRSILQFIPMEEQLLLKLMMTVLFI